MPALVPGALLTLTASCLRVVALWDTAAVPGLDLMWREADAAADPAAAFPAVGTSPPARGGGVVSAGSR